MGNDKKGKKKGDAKDILDSEVNGKGPEKSSNGMDLKDGGSDTTSSQYFATSTPNQKDDADKGKPGFFQRFSHRKGGEPPSKRGRDDMASPSFEEKSVLSESEIAKLVQQTVQEQTSALQEDIQDLKDSVSKQDEDIEELRSENEAIRGRVKLLEGRLARSEKIISDLKEELLDVQTRQMKDNLLFFNIPDKQNETKKETKAAVLKFMREELKISDNDMENIWMDKIHRNGQAFRDGKPRCITARFNPHSGRGVVLGHIKNLDKTKKYGISEQLPRELSERKKRLLPEFKKAKAANKKTQWVNDKLIIDNKTTQIKKDKLMDINVNVEETALQLRKTTCPPKTYEGSTFQGHKVNLTGQDDVIPALHRIYADSRVARATHNIYAYRIQTAGGKVLEHFEDDSEWGSGRILLTEMQKAKTVNILLCVTRWCGPKLLGKARFRHIEEAACQALAERWVLTGEEEHTAL